MLVKTRSFCRPSFERSNGSKSTYLTQFSNIAYIQKLIPPHIYIFYESVLLPLTLTLLLHVGKNQESVSFVIRVQQRIKLDLLHSLLTKNLPTLTPYSSKTKGVSPPQMLPERSSNASALVQSKSQVLRPCVMQLQALKFTLFW